jgi:hypothetical protein
MKELYSCQVVWNEFWFYHGGTLDAEAALQQSLSAVCYHSKMKLQLFPIP